MIGKESRYTMWTTTVAWNSFDDFLHAYDSY